MNKFTLKLFYIVPMNEGQELNYIEDYKGTLKYAKKIADLMAKQLQRILTKGTITVEVQDADNDCRVIYTADPRTRKDKKIV